MSCTTWPRGSSSNSATPALTARPLPSGLWSNTGATGSPRRGQNSGCQSRNHYSARGVFYLGVSGLYLIPPAQSNAAGRGHVTLASKQRQMLSFTSPTACCLYTAQDLHNSHRGCAKRLLLAHPANTMSWSLVCTRISSCSTAIQGKRYCRRYKRQQCSSFSL